MPCLLGLNGVGVGWGIPPAGYHGIVAQHHRQWVREEVMRVVAWWWALLCLLYGYCPVVG